MTSWNSLALIAAALLTYVSTAEGFFLYSSKKSSNERLMPSPGNFYRDTVPASSNGWGAQYAFDGAGPVTVALPVAVPIQAQMASLPPTLKGSVHNVQLVPCLCPVSKDIEGAYLSPMQQQPQQQTQYVQSNQPQTQTT